MEIRDTQDLTELPAVLLLDAAGTLIRTREPVGLIYSRLAGAHAIGLDPVATGSAFAAVWRRWPPPRPTAPRPAPDDDRDWWRSLVAEVFAEAGATPDDWRRRFNTCFEELFDWFGRGAAWQLYADAEVALDRWQHGPRLVVVSNFDRRLRQVLAGLGLTDRFEQVILSSEVGACKPDPRVFEAALRAVGAHAAECLYVGDDPQRDVAGAIAAGLRVYRVHRPGSDLVRLADWLDCTGAGP